MGEKEGGSLPRPLNCIILKRYYQDTPLLGPVCASIRLFLALLPGFCPSLYQALARRQSSGKTSGGPWAVHSEFNGLKTGSGFMKLESGLGAVSSRHKAMLGSPYGILAASHRKTKSAQGRQGFHRSESVSTWPRRFCLWSRQALILPGCRALMF